MNGILGKSLIALCFSVLSGCGSVRVQGPDRPPSANSTQTHSRNVVSPGTKDGRIEQWKPCVQRLHPAGSYPASEIQAMFESPQNIPQLLYNLKIAADRGLLLQPAFYDEATLLKFFHGSKVTLADSNIYMDKLSSGIEARVESDILPQVSITVSSVCKTEKYKTHDVSQVEIVSNDGFLDIWVGRGGPLITLSDIRGAFGREDERHIASEDPDLPLYTGYDKGSVKYENVRRPGLDDSRVQTRFFFKKNGVNSIGDNDVVKKMRMHDMQDHIDRSPAADAPPDVKEGGVEQWKTCAQLLHPEGSYTVSEIQAMFESPHNIPQFLHNLKIAADRRLLLQPSFYDEATLRKFFNGSEATLVSPNTHLGKLDTAIEALVTSDLFPKLAIEVASNCTTGDTKASNGSAIGYVNANGFLNITVTSGPLITLRDIRSAFGPEQGFSIDHGMSPHGLYTPTYKGSVGYQAALGAGISGIRTLIYFRKDGERYSIGDSDLVRYISMHDMQDRTWENR